MRLLDWAIKQEGWLPPRIAAVKCTVHTIDNTAALAWNVASTHAHAAQVRLDIIRDAVRHGWASPSVPAPHRLQADARTRGVPGSACMVVASEKR